MENLAGISEPNKQRFIQVSKDGQLNLLMFCSFEKLNLKFSNICQVFHNGEVYCDTKTECIL